MIISTGRNYIFVHIPKTGGTSMALALEARAMKDDVLIGDTPKAKRRRKRVKGASTAGRLWKHSTLADIDGLVPLEQIRNAFVFTLVRNPWDRAVSYYHWLRDQGFDHPAVALAKQHDFSGFLNAPHTQASFRATSYSRYVTASDGQEHCNLFIRLEHFEEDAEPLWQHLGFALAMPLENTSVRESAYQSYFSASDSRLLTELCQDDIKRFGYKF